MKIPFLIMACFMVLFAGNYDESYRLLRNILKLGAALNDSCHVYGMEVVKVDVDLIGKDIPKQVVKKLSSDFKYSIYCLGDPERIKDIDIKVYLINPNGGTVELVKDESTNPTAEVQLEFPVSGDYIIRVNAFEMQPGFTMGYFYLCIAHN